MSYESWALERLMERPRCAVESSLRCLPLRNDPICAACYEEARTRPKDAEGRKEAAVE
ncbi:MAG: hypothetical protein Kow0025_11860 [Thermodesulfovibrionales bacterium]